MTAAIAWLTDPPAWFDLVAAVLIVLALAVGAIASRRNRRKDGRQ